MEEFMTPGQVAEAFGVCGKTVTRWANAGKLKFMRTPGNHRRFYRKHVETMLNDRKRTQK